MEQHSSNLVTLYSEVTTTTVSWLWFPYIPIGKITIIAGDPGDGKSTMMMNLIAEISKGGTMPDGSQIGRPSKVIYQCSEENAGDTIKPRFESCGADCTRIGFINEELHEGLTLDDDRIGRMITEFRPRLVVIDPIQAYLGSNSDLMMATRARKLMRRLSFWASENKCAIVLIGHLSKSDGKKDLYRSFGSIDVVAAARSVLMVERDPEDWDLRVVKQVKNNLAPTGDNLFFSLTREDGFKWVSNDSGNCDLTLKMKQNLPKNKHELAAILIKDTLAEGDVESTRIQGIMKKYGIGSKTMQETKERLGVTSYRKMRKWYWHMEKETTDDLIGDGSND